MISALIQYLAAALSVGLLSLWALGERPAKVRLWAGLGLTAFAMLPLFKGLSLAQMILSANPSFSMVFISLMLSSFVHRMTCGEVELIDQAGRRSLAIIVVGLSAIVMPASLGVWPIDVYAIGYATRPLVVVIGVYALLMLLIRPAVGVVLGIALGAYAFDLVGSGNIFDSLIDGVGLFYCVYVLVMSELDARQGASEAL